MQKLILIGFLCSLPAFAESVKQLDSRVLSGKLEQQPFAEGEQAQAFFAGLGETRYILFTPGIGGFVSTSAKFGNGMACFRVFDESSTSFRCHHLTGELQLP